MTKNIQISTIGGRFDNLPYLYLHGVKNAVRDIQGLDYSLDIKEKNGTIDTKKEKKETVKFTFNIAYDEFRESMISHSIELSFLIYNTYPNFKDIEKIKGQHFNGYITKIKKSNSNTYDIEIVRTTKIYNIDLINNYWLDQEKYNTRQDAFESLEKNFLKPLKINLNQFFTTPLIISSEKLENANNEDLGHIIRLRALENNISYISLLNNKNNINNLVNITSKKLDEKLLDNYKALLKDKNNKKINKWITNIFLNNQQTKGLYIENNNLLENCLSDVRKQIDNFYGTKFVDIATSNPESCEFYYLNFKEIEKC